MQSLFASLKSVVDGRISYGIGAALLGLVFLFVLVEIFGALMRLRYARIQQRMTVEKLRWQLRETKARFDEAKQAELHWNGLRKFRVAKKTCECDDVCALYLEPHDRRPLPKYKPGQYLTFQITSPGRDKPVVRCYSLSDGPHRTEYYRVTIKKEKAPADRPDLPCGVASSYLNDVIKEGDILDVKAPTGHFFLEMTRSNPVVLIAGGVGVTPLLSMAHAIAASGSKRETWFFFGARNSKEHIHKAELEKLAAENENIHLNVCYSKPLPTDVKGRDYQQEGRVTIDLIQQLLPSSNFEYYLCGNGAFMKSITDGLEAWGVPESDVHYEAFGPATVKKKAPAPTPSETAVLSKVQVVFKRSNKTVPWLSSAGNLLDLAGENGIRIEAGCRAGSCGSCLVAIKSGSVKYLNKPDVEPEPGTCLTCICRPSGNLELDA